MGEIYYLPDSIKTDICGTPVKVGDRIMWSHFFCGSCYSCKVLHEPVLCERSRGYGFSNAYELRGGYAEYEVILAGTDFIRVPDDVTSEEAVVPVVQAALLSVLSISFIAAAVFVRRQCSSNRCRPGRSYAIVMAAQSGAAKVIAVDISENRLEFAKKWGATHVVNSKDFSDSAERVKYIRELCGGRGADVIIECSGVLSVFAENFDILSNPSKYLIIGQTSDKSVPIVPNKFQRHNAVVIGSHSGDIRHYIKALKFIQAHKNKYPFAEIISKKYKLEDANQALADMRAGIALKAALVND